MLLSLLCCYLYCIVVFIVLLSLFYFCLYCVVVSIFLLVCYCVFVIVLPTYSTVFECSLLFCTSLNFTSELVRYSVV